ncbi:peptidoglycan-binding protein [Kitasatospora sp. NPDC058444]|uniref:peptidoglycan-binding domain-containing protein n=1 Tax=Kitasatospora sp. NPDC058444 TaxID=3346504 RepID=UPI00364A1905
MNGLVKTFIGAMALVGITGGSLAMSGTALAATPARQQSLSISGSAAVTEVTNLGLSTAQAKKLQTLLQKHWGYTGAIDGVAGAGTQAAFARWVDWIKI